MRSFLRKRLRDLTVLWRVLRIAWSESRALLLVIPPLILVSALSPYPLIIFPQRIIDALLEGQGVTVALQSVLLLTASLLLLRCLMAWLHSIKQRQQARLKLAFERRLSDAVLRMPYAQAESPDMRLKLQRAVDAITGNISWSVNSLAGDRGLDAIGTEAVGIAMHVLRVLGYLALLSSLPPLLIGITIALVILSAVAASMQKRASYALRVKTSAASNRLYYNFGAVGDRANAKEFRLFSMQDFMVAKQRAAGREYHAAREASRGILLGAEHLGLAATTAQQLTTYIFLAIRLFAGTITVGLFYLYAATITNFSQSLSEIIHSALNLSLFSEYMQDTLDVMDLAAHTEPGGSLEDVDWDSAEITFENVSFRYPGAQEPVLRDVSLTIHPREKLAIVGPNGAGKTTFIKLLLGLYTPDSGRILLGGRDIRTFSHRAYHEKLTAVFQDFDIYALSLRDNLFFGREDAALGETLATSGLEDIVARLPGGADSLLGKNYDASGVELSQGQKQRVAMARAYASGARILVLDEPTAALDPMAEFRVYQDFRSLVKDQTALFISHRMSSCRLCDRIVVFDGGQIIQQGTHEALYAQEGLYARMFDEQAKHYRETSGGEVTA